MLLVFLLFPLSAFSQDRASEKYCFSSIVMAKAAEKKFKAIQVPSDQVTSDGTCLVIQMNPHRRELIQRYIVSSFPDTTIPFSSADIQREPCNLQVEKVKNATEQNQNVEMNQVLSANQNDSTTVRKETMQIKTIENFELAVDQEEIKGKCKFINRDHYQITLIVKKNPKPIVPANLPAGTIVVLNQAPPDQETMTLQTDLQLNLGERIEIGSVVKNLRNKNKDVSATPEAKMDAKVLDASEKIYLTILKY